MSSCRSSSLWVTGLALVASIGCKGILGIEDSTLRSDAPATGGSSGAGARGNGGAGGQQNNGGAPGSGGVDSGAAGGRSGSGGAASGGTGPDGGAGADAGSGGSGGAATGGSAGTGGRGGVDASSDAAPDTSTEAGPPPTSVTINEVESNGGTPGDWVEFYNGGTVVVNLLGYVFSDGTTSNRYTIPAGTSIAPKAYLVIEEATFGFGLGATDSAQLFAPGGTTLVSSYTWSAHAIVTYGACPDGSGTLSPTATSTKGTSNDCTPIVRINEIESSGGLPGDWVELYNESLIPADISGWIFRDNDDTHTYAIPAGTLIAPGRFFLLEEAAFGFGLGNPDSARLFAPNGTTIVDTHNWNTHATTTYGRCPVGGPFTTTVSPTKGAPNDCSGSPTVRPWPGPDPAAPADATNALGVNLSGLHYEPGATVTNDVIWAVRNDPSQIYRLVDNGTVWTPDTAGGWSAGRTLQYPSASGRPDAEGVTRGDWTQPDLYVSTERDNANGQVARFSVLRFVTTDASPAWVATHEWNVTADLPVGDPNRGLEGIAWIPDGHLTARGFYDERLSKQYDPADYPGHGGGLFVVGLEANGSLYVYAFDHNGSSAQRVATVVTGAVSVNDVHFDRDVGYLWAYCGGSCANIGTILDIDVGAASPTRGRFVVRAVYQAPLTLTSVANEGFTLATENRCVGGLKPIFWSDDDGAGGHALFRSSVTCGAFVP